MNFHSTLTLWMPPSRK